MVVQDLRQIQAADPRIRGVLGQSFLTHFDILIDNEHKLLCIDDTYAMGERIRGEHIQLVKPQHPESELPFTERLVIAVRLSGVANRQILLQLDSGSDGPILYPSIDGAERRILDQATKRTGNLSEAQKFCRFAVTRYANRRPYRESSPFRDASERWPESPNPR